MTDPKCLRRSCGESRRSRTIILDKEQFHPKLDVCGCSPSHMTLMWSEQTTAQERRKVASVLGKVLGMPC